jgi:hypothetical protein
MTNKGYIDNLVSAVLDELLALKAEVAALKTAT